MKRQRQHPARRPVTYSLIDELMASANEPLPADFRRHQLTRMWQGLRGIEQAAAPTLDDWRVCSEAVNLMETLITMGDLRDERGLVADAVSALVNAGRRHRQGQPIRLDGAGMLTVRAVLEDYAEALDALPARTMVRAHRRTELRIRDILAGRRRPHDVEVMDL
jgi:hypothetical protein